MKSSRAGALLVLAGAALFGTIGTARVLGPADAPAYAVAFARLGLAALCMVGLAVATRGPRPPVSLGRLLGSGTLWTAAAAQAAFQVSFLAAVPRVGVATGTLVAIGVTPLLTGLAATVRSRRPSGTWLLSTLVGLLGLALLVGVGERADPVGLLVALASSASYAAYILAGVALAGQGQPLGSALPAVFAMATLLLSPAMLLSDWGWLATGGGIAMLVWLATVPTVLAYWLFNRGLARVEAPVAATLGIIEPVVATALAVLILGETLTLTQGVGAVLIGSAVVLAARMPARPEQSRAAGYGIIGR